MSCYMTIEGTIKPMAGREDLVKHILDRYRVETEEDESGIIWVGFSNDCGSCMIDNLTDELKPLLAEGQLYVVIDDTFYYRYDFENGGCCVKIGDMYVCYDAKSFVDQLPDDVIQAVLDKYDRNADK